MGSSSKDISQLISQTANLSCLEEGLDLAPDVEAALAASNLLLVGKLISVRGINKQAFKAIISRAWNISYGLTITDLGPNIFLFGFLKDIERNRTLCSGPWSIMGHHLVLKSWDPSLVLDEIDFSLSPFWIQIHGLPPHHKTFSNAAKIGELVGSSPKVDFRSKEALIKSTFLRVQVDLNVHNPLKTGFTLKRQSLPDVWIQFKYERLSDFCYKCGRLCHSEKACSWDVPLDSGSSGLPRQGALAFGPWLRADYVKFSQENFAPHPGDGRRYDRPPERAAQAPVERVAQAPVDVQLCPVEQGQHSTLHNPPPCPTDLPPLPNLLPSDLQDPLNSSLTINPKPIVTSKLSLTDDVMPNYLSPIQDVIQTNSSPTRLLTNIPSTPFTRTTPSSSSLPSITGHSQNLTLPTLSDPPGQPSLDFTTCKRKVYA
ncbi:hypothetical protein L1049_008229 [Liquidambar formosana]|uniref:DUF4283 domain-containing protein n=1 Tax=Liquidambar formosana TaxID=63359 RepID=A0AAP0X909_LIQFO